MPYAYDGKNNTGTINLECTVSIVYPKFSTLTIHLHLSKSGLVEQCMVQKESIDIMCSVVKVYMLNKNSLAVKKCEASIRSHNGYKRPKTLISSKAKKLNILDIYTIVYRVFSQL